MLVVWQSLAVPDLKSLSLADVHNSIVNKLGVLSLDVCLKRSAHGWSSAIFYRSCCFAGAFEYIQFVPNVHHKNEQWRENIQCEGKLCGYSGILPLIVTIGLWKLNKKGYLELYWTHIYHIGCNSNDYAEPVHQQEQESIQMWGKQFQVFLHLFRYYLDIAAYSYIGLNILLFLLVKVFYLLSAWVCCPGVYLKIKKIIDWTR